MTRSVDDNEPLGRADQTKHRIAGVYLDRLIELGERLNSSSEEHAEALRRFDLDHDQIYKGWRHVQELVAHDLRMLSNYPKAAGPFLAYRESPTERIKWYRTGFRAARNLPDRALAAEYLSMLGSAFFSIGMLRSATRCLRVAVNTLEAENRLGPLAWAYVHLANLHSRRGEPRRAAALYSRARRVFRDAGKNEGAIEAANGLGIVCESSGFLRRAATCYRYAAEGAQRTGQTQLRALALAGWGDVLWLWKQDFNRARELMVEGMKVARSIGNTYAEYHALGRLAHMYMSVKTANDGLLREARSCAERALQLATRWDDPSAEARMVLLLGRYYQRVQRDDKAEECFLDCLRLAEELEDRRCEAFVCRSMATLCTERGNERRALGYYHRQRRLARAMRDRHMEGTAAWNAAILHERAGRPRRVVAALRIAQRRWAQADHLYAETAAKKLKKWLRRGEDE